MKRKLSFILVLTFIFLQSLSLNSFAATEEISISYQAHVSDSGWQRSVTSTPSSVKTAGTTGQTKRLEALKITLNDTSGNSMIKYRTHVANVGWQSWKTSGQTTGTTGQALAIEAIQIVLDEPYAAQYDVMYRVHVSNKGWLGWTKNGATAGSTGISLQTEAIQIKIVKKNSVSLSGGKAELAKPSLTYRTHIQDIGWQSIIAEGKTGGTTGRGLRMEAITISLKDFDGNNGISYNAHVSNIGWQGWKSSGQTAGTTGKSLAIEAIQIKLSTSLSSYFDIYYRMHCSNKGWLGWAKNGETAGTTGGGIQAEAIEIKLVPIGTTIDRGGTAYISLTNSTTTNITNGTTGLTNTTMSTIASKIGTQNQYKYAKSSVMCTAFSMAYCRAYLFNDYREPTVYWKNGAGAMWSWGNGTKKSYQSNSQVLAAIKAQIDSGRPCIVRVNSSSGGHCIVAFKYSGNGTSTADFTIIDPWSAKIKTLNNYTIHSTTKYIVTF